MIWTLTVYHIKSEGGRRGREGGGGRGKERERERERQEGGRGKASHVVAVVGRVSHHPARNLQQYF